MADIQREALTEQFADSALMLMMDEYAEAEGAALWEKFKKYGSPIPECVDYSCQIQIQKHYKKLEKGALLHRAVCRAAKIAAVLVLVSVLLTNLTMSVEALRVPVLNFCIKVQKQFSNLIFDSKPAASTIDPSNMLDLPDGYRLDRRIHNHKDAILIYPDSFLSLYYTNEEGNSLTVSTLPAEGTFNFDTEDAQCRELELVGMKAVYIKDKDGFLRMIWIDEDRCRIYDVCAESMEEAEFLAFTEKIAANLKFDEFYAE